MSYQEVGKKVTTQAVFFHFEMTFPARVARSVAPGMKATTSIQMDASGTNPKVKAKLSLAEI
jgi:hypothetical protein